MGSQFDPVLNSVRQGLRAAGQRLRQWRPPKFKPRAPLHIALPRDMAQWPSKAETALRSAMDRVSRHKLWAIGIAGGALVGVLLIVLIVHLARREPSDESSPLYATSTGGAGRDSATTHPVDLSLGRPYQSTEEAMAGFFAAAPPATQPAPPPLSSLVGTWEARVDSIEGDGDPGGLRDLAAMPAFSFTIKPAGDGYALTSADGKGTPRTLVASADGIVAKGDGEAPDLHLSLREQTLVGSLEAQHPARGRLEFHATRNK